MHPKMQNYVVAFQTPYVLHASALLCELCCPSAVSAAFRDHMSLIPLSPYSCSALAVLQDALQPTSFCEMHISEPTNCSKAISK